MHRSDLLLLIALLGSAAGCERSGEPQSQSMFLDASRMRMFEARARSGDIDAMRAIAAHYDFAVSEQDKAVPWLEMAVAHGSSKAMRGLAIHLATDGGLQNCRRAEMLLLRSIEHPDDQIARERSELSLANLRADRGAGYCAGLLEP